MYFPCLPFYKWQLSFKTFKFRDISARSLPQNQLAALCDVITHNALVCTRTCISSVNNNEDLAVSYWSKNVYNVTKFDRICKSKWKKHHLMLARSPWSNSWNCVNCTLHTIRINLHFFVSGRNLIMFPYQYMYSYILPPSCLHQIFSESRRLNAPILNISVWWVVYQVNKSRTAPLILSLV